MEVDAFVPQSESAPRLEIARIFLHYVVQNLAVVRMLSHTREDLCSSLENLAHFGHLFTLFFIIALVNADCINPEVAISDVWTCLSEHVFAVRADIHSFAVEMYSRDWCYFAPGI